ncbi:MAG: beta-class carbonic anhydrase [Hyphomicrobiales bacterium]
MTAIDQLLEANRAYVAASGQAPRRKTTSPRLAIVTCMDARIIPSKAFGIEEGDAHLIRNAGGRISEAIRSLVISQQLLGTTAVAVIHHTECGMLTFTDEELRQKLRETMNADASRIDFLPFTDLEESVRLDLQDYRDCPFVLQDIELRGFVFDVATGELREVSG